MQGGCVMSRSDKTLTSIVRDRAAAQTPQEGMAQEPRLPLWLPLMLGALTTLVVIEFILELLLLNLALK